LTNVTPEAIDFAYQFLLGRHPEPAIVLEAAALQYRDISHLRSAILSSPEAAATLYDSVVASLAGVWIRYPTRFGRQINICLSDLGVSKTILLSGDWEPHVGREILSRLSAGSVFVDVGANVGWFSLLAADHLQRLGSGQVISIEANPKVATQLASSILASGLDGVIRLLPYAVAEKSDAVQISTAQVGNVGGQSIAALESTGDIKDRFVVPTIALDTLLSDLKRCDVVKMDIEGAELRAIGGFEKTLQRLSPAIIMEINKDALQWVSNATVSGLLERMDNLGYAPYGPVGSQLASLSPLDVESEVEKRGYWDILFQRKSSQ
jgi:FkbM family methyltransferase